MKRRPGITLVEVLVAIFIMAIGLLALLTLFPLGALRMAQALQDDRAGASASVGANVCDTFGVGNDPQYDAPPPSLSATPLFFTPPYVPPAVNGYPPSAQVGGGIPVYVDPFGVANGSGSVLGASPNLTPGIWRVTPTVFLPPYATLVSAGPPPTYAPNPSAAAARYFSLPDDLTFQTNGAPDGSTGSLQRGGRYTWAYLLHRLQPYNIASLVDLAVVVYAGRATAVPGGEATYPASGNAYDTAVSLSYAGAQPNIHRGSWILDTSYNKTTSSVHGDFYRVVAVTPVGANTLNLELAIPLSKPDGLSALTVLDNVVEVFERGSDPNSCRTWEFHTEP